MARALLLVAIALATLPITGNRPAYATVPLLTTAQRQAYLNYYAPVIFKRANEDNGQDGRDWLTNYNQQRVRLCVASVGLAFLGLFVLSTGEWAPNYRSGDRPETIMDVSCGGAGGSPSCIEYVAGYQWPVGPGERVDTTFRFPNRQRVIQFQGMGGEFTLLPSNDCANAVLRWQMSIDGQLWRSGEVHATTGRLDTPRVAPQQAKTVVVSARRVDTEPCTAVLHWDRPTGQYRGVTSGFGPWD
ncbi:hypothetical protein [Micromonospora inyonensis]|uniref:Ig-like domain-containing protein n=1 Tax=Micromonospora inyonensis TaxID=47866 RepID=A0A1C6SHN2_9ACTN|nr:hypothetical protein [Micromonospora inyonensis]SCL29004.1 hypothetical protein GA0074694_5269 [Micromonospora inyonensis]